MVKRRTLSTKARVALFQEHGGTCHICGGKINVGEAWEVEHIIPLSMGGEDEQGNMRPAHKKCHAGKTKKDVAAVSKAKRRQARHLGIKTSKTPLPFGKNSKLKRKMDGTIVER